MKIAITGAGGLVGQSLQQHWARTFATECEVRALSHQALDITDGAAVRHWCERERPTLLINCAVIDVDLCERDLALAQAVNVDGPRHLAAAAADIGAEVLHFSTNYVFDGRTQGRVYTQADKASPINNYGRTKLAGERAVQTANAHSYIVRTSWVFGPGKESFLATLPRKLRAGERVRAITDVWASATYVNDLVARVAELLARRRYGVYHVVNGGVCSYHDYALECARLLGLDEARISALIEAVSEDEARRLAERPRYTPMQCSLSAELGLPPLCDWRAALAAYVQQS
ncbi:MAG: dTDP-4-dehydrorhamnose reductase [Acidobacteria bacterium]|nr:dTDP-4-dehydrorhamnose reductase [Acidobacteriota bacterium]MBI3423776.1 dTDP-4-dehydrorhamnose reductase [Acidobacteriota bacterium]